MALLLTAVGGSQELRRIPFEWLRRDQAYTADLEIWAKDIGHDTVDIYCSQAGWFEISTNAGGSYTAIPIWPSVVDVGPLAKNDRLAIRIKATIPGAASVRTQAVYLYIGLGTTIMASYVLLKDDGMDASCYLYRNLMAEHWTGVQTGTLKIVMPVDYCDSMISMRIMGRDNTTSEAGRNNWEVLVGGHNINSTSLWANSSAAIVGDPPFRQVRFGHDGSNHLIILLGNTATAWNTPSIVVSELIASDAGLDSWDGTWSAAIIASEAGLTVNGTPDVVPGAGDAVSGKSSADEYGDHAFHRTVLTLSLTGANDYDLADGDHGLGQKIYDFPPTNIRILGATIDGNCTSGGGVSGTYSVAVGTVTAADDATLTGGEANIIPAITVTNGTDQDCHGVGAISDVFSGPPDLYLNVAIADASNTGAGTIAITGTLTILWCNLGTY